MEKEISRRSFLGKSAALTLTSIPILGLGAVPTLNTQYSLKNINSLSEEDNFKVYIRLMGSLEPATIYSWFSGHLWGIIPGEAPKPLTTLQGLAKSNWDIEGDNITKESFDLGFFGDLETGEVLKEWLNPYTNSIVKPFHFMYGGGSKKIFTPKGVLSNEVVTPYETHWVQSGNRIWLDEYGSFSFKSPLQPDEWPKASAGKQMHFGSSTTFVAETDQLFNTKKPSCEQTFFWTAVNSWEPWMQMGQKAGYVMWRATGRKIFDVSEIPQPIKNYIAKIQPNYFDYKRPWEGRRSTYASYMEKRKDEKKN